MSDAVFGPTITADDAEKAVVNTLKQWLPLYLRYFERKNGKRRLDYPDILSWRGANTAADRFPEEQIPAMQVMLTDDNSIDTTGHLASIWFVGVIDCLVASVEPEPTRELAHIYGFCAGLALTQHPNLDGSLDLAGPVQWQKIGVPALGKPKDRRWLALGSISIAMLVQNAFDPFAGPTAPPTEGEQIGETIPPDYGEVQSHEIILHPEE